MIELNAELATIAAEAVVAVARELRNAGETERAADLVREAAQIELMSPALQACWGGPFNGQAGRTAIVDQILLQVPPQAVIETGTFRGISTEWFARHCAVPVWSCEIEEVFLIQARQRLVWATNVNLELSDSRTFLRRVVSLLETDKPSFFYLDAHWKNDLPLQEEIGIIFAAQPHAVVMIDDFRIPGDPGYAWDDYGPGVRVDATALIDALPDGASLYVPTLPSAEETGAKRGCCVIALAAGENVDRCDLLQRVSLSDLMPREGGEGDGALPSEDKIHPTVLHHGQADDFLVSSLRDEIVKINLDRAKRLQDVAALTQTISAVQKERDLLRVGHEVHLRDIDTLTRQLAISNDNIKEINAERERILQDVNTLTRMISIAQEEGRLLKADREIHLHDIDTLTHQLIIAHAEIEGINTDREKILQDVTVLTHMISIAQEEGRLLKADREIHLHDIDTLTHQLIVAHAEIEGINTNRENILQDVTVLTHMVSVAKEEEKMLKADREIHLQDIDTLTHQLLTAHADIKQINVDRERRLRDIFTLTQMINANRQGGDTLKADEEIQLGEKDD